MFVNGYFSDCSLLEVFQLLQDGKKTGLLSIQGLVSPDQVRPKYYYIWLHRGRIVTITTRLDSRGLAALISRRQYLSVTMMERLIRRCPIDEPLGRFLRSQGVLTKKQLKILFAAQVVGQIGELLYLPDGYCEFDQTALLPKVEMTGLSVGATDVILPGLRILKDWAAFKEQLPHPQSVLVSLIRGQPNVRINQAEWSVWRLMDENINLGQMATRLGLSLEQVQRIAFCLIFVGLAKEVPMMLGASEIAAIDAEVPGEERLAVRVPVSGVSEPGVSEPGVPVLGVSEPGVPETGGPNLGVPDAGVSDSELSDSSFPGSETEGESLSPSFFRNLLGFLRDAAKSS
ncbi:DUF4388 domain-containing protein [Leptothoe sp. PORK10 BA2]|uniref:DUF4388 domain-containing protein n=1 Tax=Leptothoe sp. PORK10 BA2 TaxID=3110254 RepID=UPI002B20248A|nr:DUF4388 domain-containing protein [Leptothoe sp. PORK10 BA2]MEA5464562.1 DUF4388 domain-containing protein [Leptothoe sp. PORK10 BA2]